jgi:hypothetical protein
MISEGACVTDCGEGRSAGEDRQCRLTTDSCVDGTCAKGTFNPCIILVIMAYRV